MADLDFDLHGIVGVRLVDADPHDRARVTRQLGPLQRPLRRDPDIVVRFVDHLSPGPLTYVGVGDVGFDTEALYILRGRGGASARARLAFEDVGSHLVIDCERGMPAVPHLLACINMRALAKGVLPLHASAFEVEDRGVLVMGWAKGGKTEALLGAMDRGARYIGDEWVYLAPEGQMFGLPEPIRLWSWHLDQQPRVLASRTPAERARLATWRGLAAAVGALSRGSGAGARLARRAQPVIQRQAFLQIPPAQLFGADRMALRGTLDAALLMVSHDSAHYVRTAVGPTEISDRMTASLAEERVQFMTHYRQFRFAFPDRASATVETAAEQEQQLLRTLFDGRTAFKVAHPYPCDLAELADAVAAAVEALPVSGLPGQP